MNELIQTIRTVTKGEGDFEKYKKEQTRPNQGRSNKSVTGIFACPFLMLHPKGDKSFK